ncbi:MAG: hypothetical protein WBL45_08100 [Solirubrobacterales bacterium]
MNLRKALGVAAVLAFALGPSALAAPHDPKGEFKPFGYCPLELKTVTECIYSASTGGSITIGKKTVPIKDPVIFQGGSGEVGEGVKFFGAEGVETLLETPQSVPSGLLGITPPSWWPDSFQEWFNEQINDGATDVTATLELAAPPTSITLSTQNLVNQEGTALGLPVKIKLDNPLLGSNCYLGSDAKPIQIDFTTGKSGAAKGSPGVVNFNKELTRVIINDGRLANGTFVAPSVEGCGGIYSSYIDPLVNSVLGLPSASGENTAILEGKLQSANAAAVRKSE